MQKISKNTKLALWPAGRVTIAEEGWESKYNRYIFTVESFSEPHQISADEDGPYQCIVWASGEAGADVHVINDGRNIPGTYLCVGGWEKEKRYHSIADWLRTHGLELVE